MKILLVEDEPEAVTVWEGKVRLFNKEKNTAISITSVASVDGFLEAMLRISEFDAAVVDLKLGQDSKGGETVLRHLRDQKIRIPVEIQTGTPDAFDKSLKVVGIHSKTDEIDTILGELVALDNAGLTRVLGARGRLEDMLFSVYNDALVDFAPRWIKYGQEVPLLAEKALLRIVISHLQRESDRDDEKRLPDECYIYSDDPTHLGPGTILKTKATGSFSVVLTPACDLVVREGGERKTDRLLLVDIDQIPDGFSGKSVKEKERTSRNAKDGGIREHFLPPTLSFPGGIVQFNSVRSVLLSDIGPTYETSRLAVAPEFFAELKERFSSFYSRVGQPEFDGRHL